VRSRRRSGGRRPPAAGPRSPAAAPVAQEASRWLRVGLPLAVVVLTIAVFAGTLGNGFVLWDDDENFLLNPHYRGLGPAQLAWMFTTFHLGLWIPLTWMTLGLDYVLWGLDPRGYHATSLVLHAMTALAFYFVARRLLDQVWPPRTPGAARAGAVGAAFAALLFALHPLRVESVAWATERRDVLSGVLLLLSVLAYLRASDASISEPGAWRRWYGASLGAFVLALLAKPIATTLPVLLVILDVYPLRRLSVDPRRWSTLPDRHVWLQKLPYAVLAVLAGVVAIAAQRAQESTLQGLEQVGIVARIGITCYALAFYLGKTLLPRGLSPLYELGRVEAWTWAFAAGAAVVIVVTLAAVALRRRCPGIAAAWAVNVVTVLPVSGLLQNGPQIAADRYTYLPMLGWAVCAGAAGPLAWRAWTSRCLGPRSVVGLAAFALAVLAALGTLTWRQIGVWRDTETLWTHALEVAPSARAHTNMVDLRLGQGRVREGLEHALASVKLQPGSALLLVNLGVALDRSDRPDEALRVFEEALRANPRDAYAHNNVGAILAGRGQTAEALAHFETAVRLRPDYALAHANLGALLEQTGREREAEPHLREADRLRALTQDR
jgi:protein O-mannosyl-transferase